MHSIRTCRPFHYSEMHGRQLWSEQLPAPQIPPGAQFPDIIIPTKDSARYTFLLAAALRHGYPLLFVGPTGVATSWDPCVCCVMHGACLFHFSGSDACVYVIVSTAGVRANKIKK